MFQDHWFTYFCKCYSMYFLINVTVTWYPILLIFLTLKICLIRQHTLYILLIIECLVKSYASTYNFHAIMRGLRNISWLRCSIFKIKTKDNANHLFFTVCCFNGLQQSHIKINTNTLTCQLYKNATFCFSNTHNTNSQQMNSALPSSAQLQHIQFVLHLDSPETFGSHVAYYIRKI